MKEVNMMMMISQCFELFSQPFIQMMEMNDFLIFTVEE